MQLETVSFFLDAHIHQNVSVTKLYYVFVTNGHAISTTLYDVVMPDDQQYRALQRCVQEAREYTNIVLEPWGIQLAQIRGL